MFFKIYGVTTSTRIFASSITFVILAYIIRQSRLRGYLVGLRNLQAIRTDLRDPTNLLLSHHSATFQHYKFRGFKACLLTKTKLQAT